MSQTRRPRGVAASTEGIEQLKKAKGKLPFYEIAMKAQVSDKTVRRFFDGERVDEGYADAIIKALGLEEKNILSTEDLSLIDEQVGEAIEEIERHGTNSGRASELVEELEEKLKEYKKSSNASREAMDWLKGNRHILVKEATEESLKEFYSQNPKSGNAEDSENEEQLSKDLLKYLQLSYYCLEEGTLELIEEARRESLIPLNLNYELYVKALLFIKEQKVLKDLPQEAAQELGFYLDYLVNIIPIIS
ncbi:hypothetical protein H6G04_27695 [Calothrix membranacea FACHB-236]|nr:hypothetical protein [Calothrix membranacea FACHB-236]